MNKLVLLISFVGMCSAGLPIVVNTWNYTAAIRKAWKVLKDNLSGRDNALDALTFGCNACENGLCSRTVGPGGNPDENGETTLEALIFDGDTMDMGAVAGLRRIRNAISVARHVLDYTEHSFLVGDLATDYARSFGFQEESLQTDYSLSMWQNWKANNCQPNFRKNLVPDPTTQCGPYRAAATLSKKSNIRDDIPWAGDSENHDTIGMIVISETGHAVVGTSTNGLKFNVPGRIGDTPIVGAGAYADSKFGAACATGNGDILMRFLPSFLAVEQLRSGYSAAAAAKMCIARIAETYPTFIGAIIVVDIEGNVGIACNGLEDFPYCIASEEYPDTVVKTYRCSSDTIAKYSVKFFICIILLYHYYYYF